MFKYRSLLASRIFWMVCGRLCSEGPRRLQKSLKVLIGKAASKALPLPTLFEAIHQFTIGTIVDLHSSHLFLRWWLLELSWCFRAMLRHRCILIHLIIGVGDLLDHSERVGLRWIVTPALLAIKRPKSSVSAHRQIATQTTNLAPGVTGDVGELPPWLVSILMGMILTPGCCCCCLGATLTFGCCCCGGGGPPGCWKTCGCVMKTTLPPPGEGCCC